MAHWQKSLPIHCPYDIIIMPFDMSIGHKMAENVISVVE